MKALPAATSALGIRIVKNKFTFYLIIYKIHLSAYHEHERFFVDNYSNTFLFNYFIHFTNLVLLHVVHNIRVPIASSTSDINLNTIDILIFFFDEFLYPISCMLSLYIFILNLSYNIQCLLLLSYPCLLCTQCTNL